MTPEQLLNLPKPVAELTDQELATHLAPFFPHTRPKNPRPYLITKGEEAIKLLGTPSSTSKPNPSSNAAQEADKLRAIMAKAGLDIHGQPLVVRRKLSINQ